MAFVVRRIARLDAPRWRGAAPLSPPGGFRLGYRADLEGLRALAVVLVVAAHAHVPGLAGGFVGVDVFFVLSGYLISGLLLGEIRAGSLDLAGFYARRFARLTPGLLAMVCMVAVLVAALYPHGARVSQAGAAISAVLSVSNIYFALSKLDYFGTDAADNVFLHTWSLGVEEQFYLVWPCLLLLGAGTPRVGAARTGKVGTAAQWNHRLPLGLLGLSILGLAACVLCTGWRPAWAFYLMPSRAWQFAAGALLWWLPARAEADNGASAVAPFPRCRIAAWMGWAGLAAILVAAGVYDSNVAYPGWRALLPTLGTLAVIGCGCAHAAAAPTRALSWRPLQWLGRRSYSWYLWHWPALLLGASLWPGMGLAGRIGWAVGALLPAWASHRWIESPLRAGVRRVRHPGRVIASALAGLLLVAIGLFGWQKHDRNDQNDPRYAAARADVPTIYSNGCDDWYHSAAVRVCAFGPAHTEHTAVLFGDSVLAQWFPAFEPIYTRPGWRLLVVTKSACPLVEQPVFYARIGREYVECAQWRRQALRQIAAWHPDLVVAGSAATYAFDAQQWRQGSAEILRQLDAAAARVILLRGTPRLPMDGPDCLAARGRLRQLLRPDASCAGRDGAVRDVLVWEALRQAAGGLPHVGTLDLGDLVCPQGICRAERANRVVFRDSQHLTAGFTGSLSDELARRVGVSTGELAPTHAEAVH